MKKIEKRNEKTWFTKTIKAAIREGKVKGRRKQILLYNGGSDWHGNLFYVDWSDTNYRIGSKKPRWVDGGVILDVTYKHEGNENALTKFVHQLIDMYNSSI